jgi:predicted HNH restriction endonuclease
VAAVGGAYDTATKQKMIWESFKNIDSSIFENMVFGHQEIDGVSEGRMSRELGYHLLRERNSALVKKKKENAESLACECCNFNFEVEYPGVGKDFIECHHMLPIKDGERITELKDLALVCSNCHRMLHRRNEGGEYHTIKSLKDLIENAKNTTKPD